MSNAHRCIASLKNIGAKSAERIVAVGVTDVETLRDLGPAVTFHRVKTAFPNDISLNLLWALQGALMDIHWHCVPSDLKRQLLQELETFT